MRHVAVILMLLAGSVMAGDAAACACCADPGTWYQARSPLGALERGELTRLRFTTARRTQTNEGLVYTAFALTVTLTGRTWRWDFGPGPGHGTLKLRLPTSATTLAADIHDGRQSGGGGPLLYKELRLEGSLQSVATILRGTRYRLVLQGRGNNCLNAADFRSWHLDIYGSGARYALYGTFR